MNENSGYKTAAGPRLMTINPKLLRLTPHALPSGLRMSGHCVREMPHLHWEHLQCVFEAPVRRKGHALALTPKHLLSYRHPELTEILLIISPKVRLL